MVAIRRPGSLVDWCVEEGTRQAKARGENAEIDEGNEVEVGRGNM